MANQVDFRPYQFEEPKSDPQWCEFNGESNWFDCPLKAGKVTAHQLWQELNRISSIRAKAVDNFIACYLDRTGANIEDLVLIEQESDDHLTHTWWVEPKEKK